MLLMLWWCWWWRCLNDLAGQLAKDKFIKIKKCQETFFDGSKQMKSLRIGMEKEKLEEELMLTSNYKEAQSVSYREALVQKGGRVQI